MRRAGFNVFRDLLGRMPWDIALGRKKGQEDLIDIQVSLPPSSRKVHCANGGYEIHAY